MCGGRASPSPDYPQDMRIVTGDNNVVVSNKNLLKISSINGTYLAVNNNSLQLSASTGYNVTSEDCLLKDICPSLVVGETYTLSFNNTDNTTNHYNDIYLRTSAYYWRAGTSRTITQNDLDGRVAFYGVNATISNLMIEKGSTVTSYIAHQGQEAPLNLGMRNYFTASMELGTLNDSTGATETNNNIIRSNDFMRVSYNGTYSINNDKGYHTYIYEYDSNKNFLSAITTDTSNPKTFKVSNYTRYIKIRTAEGENDTTAKFWLNFGENASDTYYPPNTAPIKLYGIEDSNDLIIGKPDNWKVLRVIRELNLIVSDMDNSEDYPGWTNVPLLREDLGRDKNGGLSGITTYYCNIATRSFGGVAINTVGNINSILFLSKSTFGLTQTQWKENYQDLIFQLHYRITNPTAIVEEPITVPTIIEQLNNIYNLTSYDGQTNITVTHKQGSSQMIISASVEI